MAKSLQVKKLVNGEIADADEVNQIAEDIGSEGGLIPYDDATDQKSTNGSESLGATAYPWGSLNINQDAELNEIDPASHTLASSVAIKNLRKFIYLKDCPSSYSGKAGYIPTVNAGETGLEFDNPPTKSAIVFCWNGCDNAAVNQIELYYGSASLTPAIGGNYFFFSAQEDVERQIIFSKFYKTPGISTVTIYARLWSSSTNATEEALLKVDIGGLNNTVHSVTSSTPAWVTASTIDVSSLTDNTVYDLAITLRNEGSSAGLKAYCSAILLTGT